MKRGGGELSHMCKLRLMIWKARGVLGHALPREILNFRDCILCILRVCRFGNAAANSLSQ